jgi:hypothetical protein
LPGRGRETPLSPGRGKGAPPSPGEGERRCRHWERERGAEREVSGEALGFTGKREWGEGEEISAGLLEESG